MTAQFWSTKLSLNKPQVFWKKSLETRQDKSSDLAITHNGNQPQHDTAAISHHPRSIAWKSKDMGFFCSQSRPQASLYTEVYYTGDECQATSLTAEAASWKGTVNQHRRRPAAEWLKKRRINSEESPSQNPDLSTEMLRWDLGRALGMTLTLKN